MTSESEAVALLRPMPFFARFDAGWLELIYSLATYRETRPGDYLVEEASVSTEVFIVLSGTLEVEVSLPQNKGREAVALLGPGELLGELCLIGLDRRSASARAVTAVATLFWERAELFALFERRYDIGYEFMRGLAEAVARKLVSTNRELSATLYHSIYQV